MIQKNVAFQENCGGSWLQSTSPHNIHSVRFIFPTKYGFGGYVQNMPEFTAEKADFPAKTAFSAKKQADSAENKCGGCRD